MTITEMKNKSLSKGKYWFSKETMKFFDSIIETPPTTDGVFISSERSEVIWRGERRYTIRKFNSETGDVSDVSELGQYETLTEALAAAGLKRKQP